MTISCSYGPIPRVGLLLTADCVVCGGAFRAVLDDEATASRAGVSHVCGSRVVGPLWTLNVPPAARTARAGGGGVSAAELTEAADFLEANGWLPTTLGTPAVEAVAAPLLPGDKGRIVAALREAAAGAPETTHQEREQARQLWIDLGRSEMAEPTPHQLLAFLRQCPESVGLRLARQMLRSAAEASRVETYGSRLGCTRRQGHDDHEHEDSGLMTTNHDDEEPRP